MRGLQPLLHDAVCTAKAPAQLWAGRDGEVHAAGVEGLVVCDERVLAAIQMASPTHEITHLGTERVAVGEDVLHYVLRRQDQPVDPSLMLRRERTVRPDGMEENLELRSALSEACAVELRLEMVPDGTAMELVKQGLAARPVAVQSEGGEWSWREGAHARLSAESMELDSGPAITLTWRTVIEPGQAKCASWRLEVAQPDAVVTAAAKRNLASIALPALDTSEAHGMPVAELRSLLQRALADVDSLVMARTALPDAPFLAAGAPWFFTLFGRDSLISARFLLPLDVELAGSTLRALASLQGQRVEPQTAEQPGKIPHELRRSAFDIVTDGGGAHLPPLYYGTIDATPLWISLLHDAWRAGLDTHRVRDLLPHLERALAWLRDYGDADGDGFLEYFDASGHGLANQGWKDSADSVRWHDGTIAQGPIALAEAQGYAYRAALDGAELLEAFGLAGGKEWRAWAGNLAERFRTAFWVSDENGPYPAIALDHAKRPVDSVASNMGHLLGTGMLNHDEARWVVSRLVDPTLFSGFGIRTVSSTNGAYWPLRYHAGSVWPHDTAMTVDGMLREGFFAEARTVARGLLEAAREFDYQLPELFGGAARDQVNVPVPYPAACHPQAWSAAAAVVVARALGVNFAPSGKIGM